MLFTELPLKKSKHIPYSNKLPSQFVTNTPYVSPLPTKSKTLWGPRNKEYSRTLSQHNKNEEHSKEHSSFLVRWKGLEPPTYWFVASHSIQLSYQRIYVLHFLCLDNITQIKQKCNTFFIFYKDYLKYIFQEYLRQAPQAPDTGVFYSIPLCEVRQAANRGRALKDREAHGILLSRFPL